MADTQAKSIRDLLIAALQRYDSSIDVSSGSRAYSEIISPIFQALSPDMFDTDLESYLLQVLKEEYPSLELQQGDVIVDLLVRPLQILLEPMKREINILRKRQSVNYVNEMTLQDAEDLAANFFVARKQGSLATGTVRILLSVPTFLAITDQVRFSTSDGLYFYPLRQQFISVDTIALQRVGSLYYADISVVAENQGDEYNVPAGSITIVEGISNFVSVSNPFQMEEGTKSETSAELLARTQSSLTERSLTSRRGITARINDEYPEVRNMQVIGYGDEEMIRDVITGTSEGKLMASGISFIFGRFVFMITGYEDNEDGNNLPSAGDKVKLNYWKFIYQSQRIEENEIQEVIYNSYGDAPDIPTVHIFLLKNNPTQEQPVLGAIPGVLPGVFTAIFSNDVITISGLPEGIYNETDGELPFKVASNEVHVGGRYDVWVRPSSTEEAVSTIPIIKSPNIIADIVVTAEGQPVTELSGLYPLNRLGHKYELSVPANNLLPREVIVGSTSQAMGFIAEKDNPNSTLVVIGRTGSFQRNETITGQTSGATTTISNIIYTEADEKVVGGVITLTDPEMTGSFSVLDVHENYYILSEEIDVEVLDVNGYIHQKTGINDLFDPRYKLFPENADSAQGLQTYISSNTVDISHNLISYGVRNGDTLDILSGDDRGRYTITDISLTGANTTEVTLSRNVSRTNSNLRFTIFRDATPLQSPLVRLNPSGVILNSASGNGYEVPYGKPVGAYALGAFSGSIGRYSGKNGFVFINVPEFKGNGLLIPDLQNQADPNILAQFDNYKIDDCISEGCTECKDGIGVTCTVTIDGNPTNYSNVKFYISGLVNPVGQQYLTDLRNWLKDLIDKFFRGINSSQQNVADDLDAFVDLFAPIHLGEPDLSEHIVTQFEMCIPDELFDGCNNVYLALPEIDWDSEFESVSTFEQAITRFLAGTMRAERTALSYARPGDSLKIDEGANAGEYVIDKVVNIPWYTGDSVRTETTVDEDGNASTTRSIVESKTYVFSFVVIRGEFPAEVLKDSSTIFGGTFPVISQVLPQLPVSLNQIQSQYITGPNAGNYINPFDLVEEAYSALFKSLYAQGFDLPEELNIIPGPTLTKIVKTFFSTYMTGNRSPQQTTRMLFQDAADVTVYSPKKCSQIQWLQEQKVKPTITGGEFSLPNSLLSSAPISVKYTTNFNQTALTLSGTLNAAAGTTTDIDVLIGYIQDALDPTATLIKVTYSNPATSVYTLTVTSMGGQGAYLEVVSDSFSDAFALLGFSSGSFGPLPEAEIPLDAAFVSSPLFNKLLVYSPYSSAPTEASLTLNNDNMILIFHDSSTAFKDIVPLGTTLSSLDIEHGTTGPFTTTSLTGTFKVIGRVLGPNGSGLLVLLDAVAITTLSTIGTELLQSAIVNGTSYNLGTPGLQQVRNRFPILESNTSASVNSGNRIYLTTQDLLPTFNSLSGTVTGSLRFQSSFVGDTILIDSDYVSVTETLSTTVTFAQSACGAAPTISMNINALFTENFEVINSSGVDDVAADVLSSTPVTIAPDTDVALPVAGTSQCNHVVFTLVSGSTTENVVVFPSSNITAAYVTALNTAAASGSTAVEKAASLANYINTNESVSEKIVFYADSSGNLVAKSYLGGVGSTIELSISDPTSTTVFSVTDHLNEGPNPTTHYLPSTFTAPSSATSSANGSSQTGSRLTEEIKAHNGTRFSLTQGSEQRQLIVDIQNEEDYFYCVLPRRTASFQLPLADYPRDGIISPHYTNAESASLYFTDSDGESALEAGVLPGDLLYVHEQVQTLDSTGLSQNPFSTKKDRLLHVRYDSNKKIMSLLTTAGTFLTPESADLTNSIIPPEDVTKVGDYVFFEDSSAIAKITKITETEAHLQFEGASRPSFVQPSVLRDGKDGAVKGTNFMSVGYVFTSADVGMYLTIYGSENAGVDGTYEIDSVTGGVAVLSETFDTAESDLHWLIVRPDFTDIGSSSVGGFSETRGVTPVRIYRGEPAVFQVGRINNYLNRQASIIEFLYGTVNGGPRRGVQQPFKIVRPHEYRITANQMNDQGKVSGLYYFDVPSTTLTPSFELNVPEDTQYTPVLHTMKMSGYTLSVANKAHVFSNREQCGLTVDSRLIPKSLNGSLGNSQVIEGQSLTFTYEYSSFVSRLQRFLLSDINRNLCADPLAKHFLPSYVLLEITGARANGDAESSIVDYIEGLEPTDSLRLSNIEKYLHLYNASTYNHPIFVHCMTYDLNRDIILTRSQDLIDDTTILHDGTNRLTYFIALPENIAVGRTL